MVTPSPRFEFATAHRVLFGPGLVAQAGPEARALGQTALVVTGRHPERAAPLLHSLAHAHVAHHLFPIEGEPDLATVEDGRRTARHHRCDLVIGFGGGSALDAAKAIAAMTANDTDLLDHLEVIGRGLPLGRPPLPCLAIPTTAGAGAEVTRNAVLRSPHHGVKASLRSPLLLPRLALVDPELTHSLPPPLTAATGLDALTQLIEPFLSTRSNPLVDSLCREGLTRIARSLRQACADGASASARSDMALASLFGGLALANAGLGAVHGFAAPLGGMFHAPHGAVCAALLPHVLTANLHALRQRPTQGHPLALPRFDEIARLLTCSPDAQAEDGIAWIAATCQRLRIPNLAAWGVTPAHLPALVEKSKAASSMKGNPIPLTTDELTLIATAALTASPDSTTSATNRDRSASA